MSGFKVENRNERRANARDMDNNTNDNHEEVVVYRNGRTNPIAWNGAGGTRAAAFIKTYRDALKERGVTEADEVTRLLSPSTDSLMNLSKDYSFLIHTMVSGSELYYHIMLFEGKSDVVARRRNTRDNRDRGERYDADSYTYVVPADCVEAKVIALMSTSAKSQIKVSGDACYTGFTIVPFGADVTTEEGIRPYLISAEEALHVTAGNEEPFTPDFLQDRGDLIIRGSMNFTKGNVVTGFGGNLIRSDLSGEIREVIKGKQTNLLLADGSGGLTYTTFSGFINLSYLGDGFEDDSRNRRRDIDIRHYQPECIITEINPYHDVQIGGLERLLMTLANLPYINTDQKWMNQFDGCFEKGSHTDLAGLGYGFSPRCGVAPGRLEGKEIDDIAGDSKRLPEFFDKVCYDNGMAFAIVLNEGAPGWIHSKVLLDSIEGSDEDRPLAEDLIIQAMDNLTNGAWSKEINSRKGNFNIVADTVRIPVGTWKDKNGGVERPAESIDMLAVLNAAKLKYPDLIEDWIDCNEAGTARYKYDTCMTKLEAVMNRVSNNTFSMSGVGVKLYLNPEALELMYDLISKSKFKLDQDFDGSSDYNRRRRSTTAASYAVRNDLAGRRSSYRSGRRYDNDNDNQRRTSTYRRR